MKRRLIVGDARVRLGWDVFKTALRPYTSNFLSKVFPEEFFQGLVEAEHLWWADLPVQFQAAVYDTDLKEMGPLLSHSRGCANLHGHRSQFVTGLLVPPCLYDGRRRLD